MDNLGCFLIWIRGSAVNFSLPPSPPPSIHPSLPLSPSLPVSLSNSTSLPPSCFVYFPSSLPLAFPPSLPPSLSPSLSVSLGVFLDSFVLYRCRSDTQFYIRWKYIQYRTRGEGGGAKHGRINVETSVGGSLNHSLLLYRRSNTSKKT